MPVKRLRNAYNEASNRAEPGNFSRRRGIFLERVGGPCANATLRLEVRNRSTPHSAQPPSFTAWAILSRPLDDVMRRFELEGKAEGPRSGETTDEGCTQPRRLRASAPPTIQRRTINYGPFSIRLESHRYLTWAESQTHRPHAPPSLPHKLLMTIRLAPRRLGCRLRPGFWHSSSSAPVRAAESPAPHA